MTIGDLDAAGTGRGVPAGGGGFRGAGERLGGAGPPGGDIAAARAARLAPPGQARALAQARPGTVAGPGAGGHAGTGQVIGTGPGTGGHAGQQAGAGAVGAPRRAVPGAGPGAAQRRELAARAQANAARNSERWAGPLAGRLRALRRAQDVLAARRDKITAAGVGELAAMSPPPGWDGGPVTPASAAAFRHALTGLVDARIAARQAQADAAAAALGPHARSYLRAARPWRAFLAAERSRAAAAGVAELAAMSPPRGRDGGPVTAASAEAFRAARLDRLTGQITRLDARITAAADLAGGEPPRRGPRPEPGAAQWRELAARAQANAARNSERWAGPLAGRLRALRRAQDVLAARRDKITAAGVGELAAMSPPPGWDGGPVTPASAAAFRHALTGLVDAKIAARQAQADAAAAALGPHARSYLQAARPWRAFLAAERSRAAAAGVAELAAMSPPRGRDGGPVTAASAEAFRAARLDRLTRQITRLDARITAAADLAGAVTGNHATPAGTGQPAPRHAAAGGRPAAAPALQAPPGRAARAGPAGGDVQQAAQPRPRAGPLAPAPGGPPGRAGGGRGTAGERLDALEDWMVNGRTVAGQSRPTDPAADCLVRAAAVFGVLHGPRPASGDDVLPGAGVPGLLHVLGAGGEAPARVDAGALAGFLYGSPGAAALVIARPRPGGPLPGGGRAARGDDQAHVYWLVADGRSGPVVLRWADAGMPFGVPAAVAPGGAADWQGGYLRDPYTRVVVFDPAGRPVTASTATAGGAGAVVLPDPGTAEAMLDPPKGRRRPGALPGGSGRGAGTDRRPGGGGARRGGACGAGTGRRVRVGG